MISELEITIVGERIGRPKGSRNGQRNPTVCIQCGASCKYGGQFCSRECYYSNVRNLPLSVNCQICGAAFKPRHNSANKACSRKCGFILRTQIARERAKQKAMPKVHACKTCGAQYSVIHGQMAWCSDECRKRWNCFVSRFNALLKRAVTVQRCIACGNSFHRYYPSHAVTCSLECKRAVKRNNARPGKARRKARERGCYAESFDPLDVMQRDGWRCKSCGVDTPKALRGSYEPNSPELDHVIPLSVGGPHTKANTQCLCRLCNGMKGARLVA